MGQQPIVTRTLLIQGTSNTGRTSDVIYIWDRASTQLLQTLEGGGTVAVAGDKLYQVRNDGGLVAWGSPSSPPVSFNPAPGSHTGPLQVQLTSQLPQATIYYTLDGSAPNTRSPSVASGDSIPLMHDVELRAIAVSTSYASSPNAATGYYQIIPTTPPPAPPALASLLPARLDSDQDGQSDVAELLAGTDRFKAEDAFKIIASESSRHAGTLHVQWTSEISRDYSLEISTDLKHWTLAEGPFPGTGERMTREISVPENAPSCFVRVKVSR